MTIYIDTDYKCHVTDTGGLTAVETDAFDGKCAECIEGSRFVPAGETWIREDGNVFTGEMRSLWVDSSILDAAQRVYEQKQLMDYEAALSEIEAALGVNT